MQLISHLALYTPWKPHCADHLTNKKQVYPLNEMEAFSRFLEARATANIANIAKTATSNANDMPTESDLLRATVLLLCLYWDYTFYKIRS
jgi:hypothetical protein